MLSKYTFVDFFCGLIMCSEPTIAIYNDR